MGRPSCLAERKGSACWLGGALSMIERTSCAQPPLPRSRRTQPASLFLIIFVTLANATGDPPIHFIGPANDRDAAAPLLADDPLLTSSTRINFHAPWADLNGGLTKGRCAGQQPQRDQDGILHQIFLQAPAW